jgi:glycosyltransferase involved in cell wall biosynthesis
MQHPIGGIRTYLKYVYEHLPAGKYGITILATDTHEPALARGDLSAHAVTLIKAPARGSIRDLVGALLPVLSRARPDVLHSHGLTAGTACVLANLPFGLPHVVTPHRVVWPDDFAPPWGALKRRVVSAVLSRADVIQAVGREARENLVTSLPGLRCETVVILNGIDVNRFNGASDPGHPSWRTAWNVPDDTVLFGFLGRMMPVKGFDYLFEAVRMLTSAGADQRPFRVVVVSDGGFIREQQSRIERAGLSSFFHFAGFIPDVATVLAELDAVVIPSVSEACSILAMECLVAGCPVIASRCAGLRELIEGSPAVGVPPGDASAIAAAMIELMRDPSRARAAARGFVPAARASFDARRVAAELDLLLDRVRHGTGRASFVRARNEDV